jgi:hypothetical protein
VLQQRPGPLEQARANARLLAPALSGDELEQIAVRAVELLVDKSASRRLLSPAELAAELGCSRRWVYAHKQLLGVRYLGTGQRPRLGFDLNEAWARLAAAQPSRRELPDAADSQLAASEQRNVRVRAKAAGRARRRRWPDAHRQPLLPPSPIDSKER